MFDVGIVCWIVLVFVFFFKWVSVFFGIGIFGFFCYCLYFFWIWDMWRLWELWRILVFVNIFCYFGVVSFKWEFMCCFLIWLFNYNLSFKWEIYIVYEIFLCCVVNLCGVDNEGCLFYWLFYYGFFKNLK